MALWHVPKKRRRYIRERVFRAAQILKSPYRRLITQDTLNYTFFKYSRPKLELLDSDGDWQHFQIEDHQFYWPQEYSENGLTQLYKEIFVPSAYNPHGYEVGAVEIHPGDWVVDAGACEGFFVRYALLRGAKVLAVEPVPRLVEALKRTFAEEIEVGDVRLLQSGLGPERSEMSLSIPPNEVYSAAISSDGTVKVPVYTLDDLVSLDFVPKIDFLKMDIEGFETEVFKGAKALLSSEMPKLSVAVYHALHNAQIVQSQILDVQPKYHVSWRGIFLQESFGLARPYMLHASI